ncbi:MAG TPA: NADH-quinone oxidoreductase subunit J [Gammaproteobacteria bacterium]|nr:NADH-quinone oxidoreductase subunit J [Gammaproteobacteria bacterium]
MLITSVLFYVFAAILILAALGVITARNPVHAALFLVLAFVQSAVLWILLEAEFLAIALVLVYVGAVMVLFLFVVMMLNINVAQIRAGFTRYLPLGAIVALVVVFEIANVVWFKAKGLPFVTVPARLPADYSNTKALGAVIYTQHVFAFEVAAVLLLLAIVSAITLTMRKRAGLKVQDVPAQVAVRPQDRVRIMKVKPVRESEEAEDEAVAARGEPAEAVEEPAGETA